MLLAQRLRIRRSYRWDGSAIAYAVAKHLGDRVQCRTLFATHYAHMVRVLCEEHSARVFQPRHMHALVHGANVIFTFRLTEGIAPSSHAHMVARLAGVPDFIIAKADHASKSFARQNRGKEASLLTPAAQARSQPSQEHVSRINALLKLVRASEGSQQKLQRLQTAAQALLTSLQK